MTDDPYRWPTDLGRPETSAEIERSVEKLRAIDVTNIPLARSIAVTELLMHVPDAVFGEYSALARRIDAEYWRRAHENDKKATP